MQTAAHFEDKPADDIKIANEPFPPDDRTANPTAFLLQVLDDTKVTPDLMAAISAALSASGFDVALTPTSAAMLAESFVPNSPKRAAARGEARLVQWTKDGTLVEGTVFNELWDLKRQSVDAARERGELFSVWVKGQHWYPSEAMNFARTEFAAVNRALGDNDPSSKLIFLMRKHGALGGKTPSDAVAEGKLDDVLRVAAEWARA